MVEVVEADGVMGKAVAAGVAAKAVPGPWPLSVRLSVERCTPSVSAEAMPDVRTLSGVGCELV